MNVNSLKFRYKKVMAINEVGKSLRGKLLEFHYGLKSENPPEIICSSEEVFYYDMYGNPMHDFASQVKIGDYIVEYL